VGPNVKCAANAPGRNGVIQLGLNSGLGRTGYGTVAKSFANSRVWFSIRGPKGVVRWRQFPLFRCLTGSATGSGSSTTVSVRSRRMATGLDASSFSMASAPAFRTRGGGSGDLPDLAGGQRAGGRVDAEPGQECAALSLQGGAAAAGEGRRILAARDTRTRRQAQQGPRHDAAATRASHRSSSASAMVSGRYVPDERTPQRKRRKGGTTSSSNTMSGVSNNASRRSVV